MFLILASIIMIGLVFAGYNIVSERYSYLTKGGRWLLEYKNAVNDPGILWIMSEINSTYCHNEKLADVIKNKFQEEFANNPTEVGYGKLFGIKTLYTVDERNLEERKYYFDDLLLPALYCDKQPITTTTQKKLFDTTVRGYDLTHRLLGILFLKQNNCLDGEREGTMIHQIIDHIDISPSELFSDLYAEKIAFVQFAGYGDRISQEMIDVIIHNQTAAGAWKDSLFGIDENPHTTALSLWALSQYYNKCPF